MDVDKPQTIIHKPVQSRYDLQAGQLRHEYGHKLTTLHAHCFSIQWL